MNGEGKKHTLRFDPRTELLLLVLANIVAFTQHSVWVEITWVDFWHPQANWQSHLEFVWRCNTMYSQTGRKF